MSISARGRVGVWLAGLVACAIVVARSDYGADLAAFLPSSPSPVQRFLVGELREGVASRLALIGIEGAAETVLAGASRAMLERLRGDEAFAYATNGAGDSLRADGRFLLRNRYLLSPDVAPERFSVAGIRAGLERQLDLLGSPAGMLVGDLIARDPTGEMLGLADRLQGAGHGPDKREGVWFSADGRRALLVAQTRAPGFDIDAQERALGRIRAAFADAARESGATAAKLVVTGPGVFAVESRAGIKRDALRFSLLGTVLVAGILLLVYRSLPVLGLTLVPVASGALAGIAAVSLAFGSVHGVTIGFGATLIGESVDYAIYLFTNTAPGSRPQAALQRIWPTLRLGMLTSAFGFGAMLFSGFPGLAQLGLFSIAGLVVAVYVTRWVLPGLVPRDYHVRVVAGLGPALVRLLAAARRLRPAVGLLAVAAVALLALKGPTVWDDELSSLSPVPLSVQRLDQQMRADLGAPDIGPMVIVSGRTQQEALEAAEQVGAALAALQGRGVLEGYDSPAFYLPSEAAQRRRQQAIPPAPALRANLAQAAAGLPFRAGTFAPFLEDAQAAAAQAPVTDRDLAGTGIALKLQALLGQRGGAWHATLPLRGVRDADAVREALAAFGDSAVLLDMKRELDGLYHGYRLRALGFALLGALAIAVLLGLALRSARRSADVLAPLVAAVLVTAALLVAVGTRLNIFHLVALLLVVGVGSNYTLFFERGSPGAADPGRTATSVLFCNLATVAGFGVLGFASTPVLGAIGTTVAIGALLSLAFAVVLAAAPVQARATAG
ncbi:MAG TPA: MMPL family transporter [Burkholderiales bacterium]|nr:MMPL family transporter [Burkholderiales bacterium]